MVSSDGFVSDYQSISLRVGFDWFEFEAEVETDKCAAVIRSGESSIRIPIGQLIPTLVSIDSDRDFADAMGCLKSQLISIWREMESEGKRLETGRSFECCFELNAAGINDWAPTKHSWSGHRR